MELEFRRRPSGTASRRTSSCPAASPLGASSNLDEQRAKRENRTVESVSAESTASIPLGRYGEPEECGKVVAFLASTAASFFTGSVIRADGGLIASV
jgi:3-oxoacyl-[acyl-carrier protein] reductase